VHKGRCFEVDIYFMCAPLRERVLPPPTRRRLKESLRVLEFLIPGEKITQRLSPALSFLSLFHQNHPLRFCLLISWIKPHLMPPLFTALVNFYRPSKLSSWKLGWNFPTTACMCVCEYDMHASERASAAFEQRISPWPFRGGSRRGRVRKM